MEGTSGGMTNSVSDDNLLNSDHMKTHSKKSPEFSETLASTLDGKSVEERLEYFVQREKLLVQKLNQNEENFGQKRAKFMEMYLQVGGLRFLHVYYGFCYLTVRHGCLIVIATALRSVDP